MYRGVTAMRLIGWRGLGISSLEERHVKAIIDRHMHRISVLTGDIVDVNIRVKQKNKGGVAHRFDINLSLITSDGVFYSNATGWNIIEAAHKAFNSVERQVQSKQARRLTREPVYPEPLLRL